MAGNQYGGPPPQQQYPPPQPGGIHFGGIVTQTIAQGGTGIKSAGISTETYNFYGSQAQPSCQQQANKEDTSNKNYQTSMDPRDKARLNYNKKDILKDVKASELLPKLLEKKTISPDDRQRIERAATDEDKMEELLAILQCRGPNAYKDFREVLNIHYDWIVKDLDQTPERVLQGNNE